MNAKTLPATQFQSVQKFIDKIVKEHNFNKDELSLIFSQIKLKVAEKPKKGKKSKPKSSETNHDME
jgi:hypothetical protein